LYDAIFRASWCMYPVRATSRINGVVYHPWSDGDLAELKKVSKLGSKFEGEQKTIIL